MVRKGKGNSTGLVECTSFSTSSTSKSLVSNKTVEVHGETTAGECHNSSGCCPRWLKRNKKKPPRTVPRRLMKNCALQVDKIKKKGIQNCKNSEFLNWIYLTRYPKFTEILIQPKIEGKRKRKRFYSRISR